MSREKTRNARAGKPGPPMPIGESHEKLFKLPGVIYPAYMQVGPGKSLYRKKTALHEIPDWAITSFEAAKMLGCNPSSARELLHRKGIRSCNVLVDSGAVMTCWDRDSVRAIAETRVPIVKNPPENFISLQEAMSILRTTRNTVRRYVRCGLMKSFHLRVASSCGSRVHNFYLRSEVLRIRSLRNAVQRSEAIRSNDDWRL